MYHFLREKIISDEFRKLRQGERKKESSIQERKTNSGKFRKQNLMKISIFLLLRKTSEFLSRK